MKKITAFLLAALMVFAILSGCAANEGEGTTDVTETAPQAPVTSAVKMKEQGNPTEILLADIAEESGDAANAWIKISTQYDPTLSIYSYDLIPSGTIAIAVTFTVSNFDCGESTLYWGYQLISGGQTFAVWDGTSPADTLTVNGDGTYTIVFNANTALGGPIETIESFQLVFPCTMETLTEVSVDSAKCITDEADLAYFVTGAVTE